MTTNKMHDWIIPDWPVAKNIRAFSTTRQGGFSAGAFKSFNLGEHVNDNLQTVLHNRAYLRETLNIAHEPFWLQQVHGTTVLNLDTSPKGNIADAAISQQTGKVCVIMTADCMPVLFSDKHGQCVAAAHAGWRGLCEGVLENTVQHFDCPREEILVWLGPAIGAHVFEVGDEVRTAFLEAAHTRGLNIEETSQAFKLSKAINIDSTLTSSKKWLADLYALARQRLHALGIQAIYSDESCTFSDPKRFYSYRREAKTGRMASLIWKT